MAQPELVEEEIEMKAEMAFIDGEKYLILENYAKALEMFNVAREIKPDEPAIYYKIAQVHFKNEQYDQAVAFAEKAIELNPENPFYYVLSASIEAERSDLKSAEKWYRQLLELPDTDKYLYDLATIQKYRGHYKDALETMERIEQAFGMSAELVREKQAIYRQMNKPKEAIAEWERLIERKPWESENNYSYAELLIDLGETQKARAVLEETLAENPNDSRASLLLAETMKTSGNTSGATKAAENALLSSDLAFENKAAILSDLLKSTDPDNADNLKQVTQKVAEMHPEEAKAQALAGDVFYQLNEPAEALKYYLKSVELNAGNFVVWQNILSIESDLGRFKDLEKHADEALLYFPNQASVYYLGATAKIRLKKYRQAAQLLEAGKNYAVQSKLKSVFYSQLGDAYNGQKAYDKSDAAFEKALEINANNEHALNNYSYFLALRETNLAKAEKLSERLIELKPDVATYLDTHGWVLYMRGAFKDAAKFLKKAASMSQKASILEHYGDALYKIGDKEKAVEQWKKALEQNGGSALLEQKIADEKLYE